MCFSSQQENYADIFEQIENIHFSSWRAANYKDLNSVPPSKKDNKDIALERDICKRKQKADRIYSQYQSSKLTVACQPYIPKNTLEKLKNQILPDRDRDFQRVFNYWKLKRWSRSGASLIRHLPQKVKTDYKQLLSIDPHFADYLKGSTANDKMHNSEKTGIDDTDLTYHTSSCGTTNEALSNTLLTGISNSEMHAIGNKNTQSSTIDTSLSKTNSDSDMQFIDYICLHLQKEDVSDPFKLVKFLDSLDVRHYFYDLKTNQTSNDSIMDFKSMYFRLNNGEYSDTSKIWDDFHRILDQCYSRLSSRHSLYRYAKRMERKALRIIQ
ncbi:hypothetical protein GJ496_001316 [Pomphorhynchus laevis]|nr:hypothetical protein GJ496_001316 [Pomphorhynchus laevis]